MLRLVGHSGVGKSGLLKEVEGDEVIICRELSSFGKWVDDKDPTHIGKTKILFLDESNIEDLHFTMFSPLKNGGNRRILHEGKFYQLSENHKVVFACNPAEYGGGRKVQKLFEDTDIPAIELRDFPRSYIYEKILKEGGDLSGV